MLAPDTLYCNNRCSIVNSDYITGELYPFHIAGPTQVMAGSTLVGPWFERVPKKLSRSDDPAIRHRYRAGLNPQTSTTWVIFFAFPTVDRTGNNPGSFFRAKGVWFQVGPGIVPCRKFWVWPGLAVWEGYKWIQDCYCFLFRSLELLYESIIRSSYRCLSIKSSVLVTSIYLLLCSMAR